MKRPQHHFTPPRGWMNDPNGLVFHKGWYHLFYQHNPENAQFGNIGWGHARSRDLMQWEHLPMAFEASQGKMIYSGCVVYDQCNTLGHVRGAGLVAIFTEHHYRNEEDYEEQLAIATSHDDGLTWQLPDNHVVLRRSEKDFRDPKVFWHGRSKKWVMVVALPKAYEILIYQSSDLRNWELQSSFKGVGPTGQYWECPDLFPINDESGNRHWILSMSGANPDGKTWGMFYFIGQFDGTRFSMNSGPAWLDYGTDFYAGVTFSGLDEPIMMAWSGNWAYANQPTKSDWNGMMALPRKLALRSSQLWQQPITHALPTVSTNITKEEEFVVGDGSCQALITANEDSITIDRKNSPMFLNHPENQLVVVNKKCSDLSIYRDEGILEIFANKGSVAITVRL